MALRTQSLVRQSWWTRMRTKLFGRSTSYEAATDSRLRHGWTTKNPGPNSFGRSAANMRARARDGERNDPHIARIVTILSQNIVGYEIEPRPLTTLTTAAAQKLIEKDVSKPAKLASALYAQWKKAVDVEGILNAGAAQNLVARSEIRDGEVYVIRRIDRRFSGIPLRLDIQEADMLAESKTGKADSGNRITQGVEFNELGQRVAYHFYRTHPGESDSLFSSMDTVRIPADDVIPLFMPTRAKQVRGVTRLAPILAKKVDLGSYENFELQRKKTEALVVGVVTPEAEVPGSPGQENLVGFGVENSDGEAVEQMQPGMFVNARNGKDIRFNQPTAVGGYAEYKRAILQEIAVGVQMTYELLTGDLSQVNYSSLRAGLLQFWLHLDQLQWMLFIPQYCQRVWEWFCSAAWEAGELPTPYIPVSWSVPKRPQVDPLKDILADIMRVRAGFAPQEEVTPEYGYTLDEVLADAKALDEKLAALGITFDTDPQRYSFRGSSPVTVAPLPYDPKTDEESSA